LFARERAVRIFDEIFRAEGVVVSTTVHSRLHQVLRCD
jgi:hypothetical protein